MNDTQADGAAWFESQGGMTVKQLKAAIAQWPEEDPETGEACEVWIGSGGHSNPCRLVIPLNRRISGDGAVSADLLLEAR